MIRYFILACVLPYWHVSCTLANVLSLLLRLQQSAVRVLRKEYTKGDTGRLEDYEAAAEALVVSPTPQTLHGENLHPA